ncbi:methionine/alanine import family NSS transporter small subunit [Allosaccharopolyspora coralli]|uniref:Methionine/alanine import family NSS transporter small subunit n=1 Tax=Allosaccharopolyspora coralli TaxID=2665642 RepID=A0A5Q3QAG0_9PSEU|nr:methionine/alanine import family NSS transporter small subunit [Allosaccharopolyspora coralli]QGK68455.1 methionine/alanine import family NSS transporter small subunit [Allosaccharopolyspora coralli]
MSTAAVLMMIVAIVLVWGGLIASAIHLRRHPETPEDDPSEQ